MTAARYGAGLVVLSALLLPSCARSANGAAVDVAAGFYPVAWAVGEVGGRRAHVDDLTPSGVEAHDLELDAGRVDALVEADVAILMGRDFQPAVEEAAEQRDGATVLLLEVLPSPGLREGDPHVWLDPTLMIEIVDAVETALAEADPAGAPTFRRNAQRLRADLRELDAGYRAGLEECERDLLVTAHEAFGYLTDRYGLRQQAVAGIAPDVEPDPRRLADLADLVQREGVTTVFTEELASPEIAETLAREAGGLQIEVLSPLETLTEEQADAGDDYLGVMRSNLDRLRAALGCA